MADAVLQPLRILQVGPTRWHGGVAIAVTDLTRALADDGHDVRLFCNGGDMLGPLEEAGVGIHLGRLRRRGGDILRDILPMARLLREFRPDIVHAHGRASALVATAAGRYPDWFTLHMPGLTDQIGWYDSGLLRRLLSPFGRGMIVLSDEARTYCQTVLGLPGNRIVQIPNGIDVERFQPATPEHRAALRARMGVDDSQMLVLFVGRFSAQKQPEAVVQLAAAQKDAGDDRTRFLMIGGGRLKPDLKTMIADLGLQGRVTLRDFEDPLPAYQAADLLVMPSLYEGFGLVAVEAMAAGCPVLRSRTGGFHDMIEEGQTGYGCDVDPGDFIRRATQILSDPADLPRVRETGRCHARTAFSRTRQVKATVEAYRAGLERRNGIRQ